MVCQNYAPSNEQQRIIMKQIVNKAPTELEYVERSVFLKEVNSRNLWVFELGTQECVNPIWIYVAFQQNDRQHDQNLNNDTFYRLPILVLKPLLETRSTLMLE